MDAVSFMIGIAVGAGACSGVGAWAQELAERKQARKGRRDAAEYIEKLAWLKDQGSITEEEFADQKRRCFADVGVPKTADEAPTSPLGHVRRLAELRDREILTDDEISGQKARFLRLGAEGPTAEEIAGLDHIEKLADLLETETITQEEFDAQKREILGGEFASTAKPSRPWDDFDEP